MVTQQCLLDQHHLATIKHARGEEAVCIQHCYRIVEQIEGYSEQSRGIPPTLQRDREWLRKTRNRVEHEPRGTSKEAAERALKFTEKLLISRWQQFRHGIQNYPFCLARLRQVLDAMKEQF